MKKFFFIPILIAALCGCDRLNFKLRLVNLTKDTLYFQTMYDTDLYEKIIVEMLPPDTLKVGRMGGWEYKINKRSQDSTLYLFIFTEPVVTTDVIINKKYKVKGFKVKDLDRLNWVVTYPFDTVGVR